MPPGAVQILADQMNVSQERQVAMAEGNVQVIFDDGILTCDKMSLFTDTHDVYAQGRVRMERGDEVFRGEFVHYNIDNKKGRFLQGTGGAPPWFTHGQVSEHLAEGVMRVTAGHVTSCEFNPPHFRFQGRTATVFTKESIVRGRNVVLFSEELPLIYLPSLTLADRQSPFFIIPGKKKPWEEFALMGYHYELPNGQSGALRLDWRRTYGWAPGLDHRFENDEWGKGLLKVYYNEEPYSRALNPKTSLPKGAAYKRYRVLWRHQWQAMNDTSIVTNIQEFSDVNFRQDFLFREEFVEDSAPDSFVSMVTGDPHFSLTTLVRKRMNRFQTVTEAFPEATLEARPQPIGESRWFTESKLGVANLQTKTAHSTSDTDVVRVDWFQQISYAMNWFRPILVTPKAGVRQTYYTKDIQGGAERPQGNRDLISGQFSMGADASLKLFRIFPVASNLFGLNLHLLRHVLTPTVAYTYLHQPTVPSSLLSFAMASGTTNQLSFGLENKLQTKRPRGKGTKPQSVDVARWLLSIPYTFQGNGNKQGGRLGEWAFDIELFPWPWLRVETNWSYPSHFLKGSRDERITAWNVDLVMVGGGEEEEERSAQQAPDIQAPTPRAFEPGPRLTGGLPLLPQGQWYLGLGHRYSYNDKTEEVIQFDWRLSEKWQLGTYHRFTWKEVAGASKRFMNVREYQYTLTRDLHDWMAELVYRVDREFGEELFFTMTLKAYPNLPIEFSDSYHQPKIGSQDSPFSPVPRRL